MNEKAKNPVWLRRGPQEAPGCSGSSQGHSVGRSGLDVGRDEAGGPTQAIEVGMTTATMGICKKLGVEISWVPGGFLLQSSKTGISKFCSSPSDLDYYFYLYLLGPKFMEVVASPRSSRRNDFRVSFHSFLQHIALEASRVCSQENVQSQGL